MSDNMTAVEELEAMGLGSMAEELKEYYRNAIGCYDKDYDGEIPTGVSKIGGFPDLPPEIEYPTMTGYSKKWLKGQNEGKTESYEESAMQLVAQINLAELAQSGDDVEKLLPEKGMLYIFWSGEFDLDGSDWVEYVYGSPEKKAVHKIILWDGDMTTLKRTAPPCPYYSKYFEECLPEHAVEFGWIDEYEQRAEYEVDGFIEALDIDPYDLTEGGNKLFGFPKGGNAPQLNSDTLNLFQFDYNEGCLWAVYWLISRDDMLRRDFSNVVIDWDCD